MKVNYLIIGQGLAGTMLAHFLEREGKTVFIIDNRHLHSASCVAAGLINPITGRRFVKSWRVDELIPFARQTYREAEALLGISFFHERNILRALFSAKEDNDWWATLAQSGHEDYAVQQVETGRYRELTHPAFSYGEVRQSAQVDLEYFLGTYAQYWMQKGCLRQEHFPCQDLEPGPDIIRYRDIEADVVVFCEGPGLAVNPFFNYLPMEGAKGEVLIIRIPGAGFQKILKHRIFIAPLGEDLYWAGATYAWNAPDDQPTAEKGQFLRERLDEILKVPYEVVRHRSAIRPTVKDRRPLIGFHPEFPHLVLFNGLGTKGSSLAPFWGHHLAQVLTGKATLDPAVDIRRFEIPPQ